MGTILPELLHTDNHTLCTLYLKVNFYEYEIFGLHLLFLSILTILLHFFCYMVVMLKNLMLINFLNITNHLLFLLRRPKHVFFLSLKTILEYDCFVCFEFIFSETDVCCSFKSFFFFASGKFSSINFQTLLLFSWYGFLP